ncbi:MAG: tetratricopeptide repeat protein [Planctomycetales bacterium]|nr:tetratricopeptide repeat protein [Planctomycetales bacterium]
MGHRIQYRNSVVGRFAISSCLCCCVVTIASLCHAQLSAKQPIVSDLASIRIEADSLKSEQLAIGERLVKEYPDSFNVLRIMGYVHSTHGNLQQMAECWERCRQISPNRPDIYDQLGRHAFSTEAFDDAIQHWEKTLTLDPKFSGVHRRMGEALIAAGKPAEAAKVLEQAVAIDERDFEAHYQLGESLFQLQQYEQAKAAYQRAVAISSQYSKAVYGLVKSSARLAQADDVAKYSKQFQSLEQAAIEADQDFRKNFDDLQKIRSDVAVTFVDSGRIYAADNRTDEALKLWLRAAVIDKQNEMSRNLAAKLYLTQKKPTEALHLLQELVAIDPENAMYHQQAGMLMATAKHFSGAEKHFRKLIELEPKRGEGYRLLAKLYLNTRRNRAMAVKLAAQALKIEPVADSYFVLGWAFAQNNQMEPAEKALRRAIELAPNNKTYQQLFESIFRNKKPTADEAS